jgi:hypothetical protein
MRSWVNRTLNEEAIEIVSSLSNRPSEKRGSWSAGLHETHGQDKLNAVTKLAPLEGFVFVTSVLECRPRLACASGLAREVSASARAAALLKKLRAYDRLQERASIGRQVAAAGFDPETDVGASKDKGQPICWPHPVSPLALASTATPPLRCSA